MRPKFIPWGRYSLGGFLLVAALAGGQVQAQERYRVYFGTYTGKGSKGIYQCEIEGGPTHQIYVNPIHTPQPEWQEYQAVFT